ncbi:DUF2809 domain-containing protein [uncultured Flavobacterium sp.]|uniref:ribosomal maturation YjgA family protein n=1 Tax=uncultured Flavobacterium sp. TaxID=165435 RepID=UPI0025DEB659|nr:DUF2809 domain-containing protein [uncultured Flavobacterium sp.]
MKIRIRYFLIICLIIILGLLSRKTDFIPLFIGDILYAVMIYFIIRFLLLKSSSKNIATISILICYTIEFFQLYQADWIVGIRNTTLGHLILGQGFLWSDLVAYTFGILISYFLEKRI